jgi:type I restriction enzyme S subunit
MKNGGTIKVLGIERSEGWVDTRLEDVCNLQNGFAFKSSLFKESGCPILRISNIQNDEIETRKLVFFDPQDYRECLDKYRVVQDDLLIAMSGATTGKLGFNTTGKVFYLNQRVGKFEPGKKLDKSFLYYYLSTKIEENLSISAGSAQPNLSTEQIKGFILPLPPLPEQQLIVGILDEAFEGIATAKANAEKNLQNARALFESHLQSVLLSKKWKWKTLGDLCEGVEYGSSAKSKKEGKVPVLRMGNIQDGKLDWEKLAYTDDKDEIKKYLLKHNDVLFNRTNSPELVGKTAIYKSEMPALFAGYLIRIHRKEDLLDADYLNYFLNSQIALDYGKTVVISSVNQANINGAKLKGYPIPAPSISEQRIIVKKFDSLSEETQRLESIYQQKLAALEALKKSLLHQAFTGQLAGASV